MDREGIIIIICIGIVVLFYLFQNNTAAVEQVDLVKEAPKEVYSTTPDSLDNKEIQGTQPK